MTPFTPTLQNGVRTQKLDSSEMLSISGSVVSSGEEVMKKQVYQSRNTKLTMIPVKVVEKSDMELNHSCKGSPVLSSSCFVQLVPPILSSGLIMIMIRIGALN